MKISPPNVTKATFVCKFFRQKNLLIKLDLWRSILWHKKTICL